MDEEQSEALVPSPASAAGFSLGRCCFCTCGAVCCLTVGAVVGAAVGGFIYAYGKSDCGRAGDFPGAVCNVLSTPCNVSTGWECRLWSGCVYGPAVGKMSLGVDGLEGRTRKYREVSNRM